MVRGSVRDGRQGWRGRIGFLARFIKLTDIYTEYPRLVIRHRVRDVGDLDPT